MDGHESEVGHDCKMTSGPETTTSTTTTTVTTSTTTSTSTTSTSTTSITTTPITTVSTTPDDPSFYNGCNDMILNACEINDCPKQPVYGLENANVCQLTCLVSPDICQSWVYLNKEKVKAKALPLVLDITNSRFSISGLWIVFMQVIKMDERLCRSWGSN